MKNKLIRSILLVSLVASSSLVAEANFKSCAGCHGQSGEKKALGKSKIISNMSKEDIVIALNGYKDGSYGGTMKGLMKGQVIRLSKEDINSLSETISTFKNK